MNQEKIGKFIARKRKEKSLTQENLAEKLGIIINAVRVTINEILSGEEIKEEDLRFYMG